MVVIAGAMGIAITSLINNLGNPSGKIVYIMSSPLCLTVYPVYCPCMISFGLQLVALSFRQAGSQ